VDFIVGNLAHIAELDQVKLAEDVGITHYGAGQGPLHSSDPFQFLALAARETSTIKLGPYVLDPLTRIAPSVANSLATLNLVSEGRGFLGLGTANSALHAMGRKSAKPEELAEAVQVISALVRGGRIDHTWRGETKAAQLLGAPDAGFFRTDPDFPIYIAAGGPKGVANAARYADAILYCAGPNPDFIKLIRRELEKEVAAAGRAPGSVKLIGLTFFYQLRNGETWEDALTKGFGTTAPMGSTISDMGYLKKFREEIGADIVDKSIAMVQNTIMGDPVEMGAESHLDQWDTYAKGFDERHMPYMSKEILDFWTLYGSPDDLLEKAQLMMESGLDALSVFLYNPFTARRDIADIGSSIIARM
jgi:alkanesulfonate monooxygenase SsuD/methylene tetrahydromethanopterin reductase-like flavin-dependent oxidoreductase (luciferase family)